MPDPKQLEESLDILIKAAKKRLEYLNLAAELFSCDIVENEERESLTNALNLYYSVYPIDVARME